MSAEKSPIQIAAEHTEHNLPDGRTVVLNWEDDGGELTLLAPSGDLELQVRITPDGPVLQLTGARLELSATESVSIQAKTLELSATEKASLRSDKDLHIQTSRDVEITAESDVRVLGAMIHLN